MSTTLNLLRREHAHLAKILRLFDRQIARFGIGERPDYDIISGIIEYCLDFPDQCHHPKEDLIYRKLRERDPETAEAVGDFESEHDKLTGLTLKLAAAVRRVLDEAELPRDFILHLAEDFVATYRMHMEMEEQLFFPAAERVLTRDDWAEIDAHMTDHRDPLFGNHVRKKFQSLRDDIYAMDRVA